MPVKPYTILDSQDITSFKDGVHFRLYEKLGSRLMEVEGEKGAYFSVFAPAAKEVYVITSYTNWKPYELALNPRWDSSGIWEGFIPGIKKGDQYKYLIISHDHKKFEKADPYAWFHDQPPGNASVVWDLDYEWKDQQWMEDRSNKNSLSAPVSVYELHLESWRRHEDGRIYSYLDLKKELVPYIKEMGFTHVEFMPITEYPYPGSWGYQATGFFAASSRFGTPQELKQLIDALHQADIGVIIDWVPSHFPSDGHGLAYFDGSHVYEHPDPRKGYHKDWKSMIFNYERNEVRAFLISSALFWMDHYHIDGIRVDAVASIVYLDYSRDEGEWEPNIHGGRENLAAISLLQQLNTEIYATYPDTLTIAEESTAFPLVSRPVDVGGLGFKMKWMMGWMNDTLEYFKQDPLFRKGMYDKIKFSIWYAFSENFMLPLSHDEVVHGKASLIYKMPGDMSEKMSHLRSLYAYMYTHPGAKLLFMGAELAQTKEWDYQSQLSWDLLQYDDHKNVQKLIQDLNKLYRAEPALYEQSYEEAGYEWVLLDRWEDSIISYKRHDKKKEKSLLVVINFTPVDRDKYHIPLAAKESWKIKLCTQDQKYGGVKKWHGKKSTSKKVKNEDYFLLSPNVPGLSVTIFDKI